MWPDHRRCSSYLALGHTRSDAGSFQNRGGNFKRTASKKKKKKENTLSTKKTIKKKKSSFLGRFLVRERVFFLFFLTIIVFSFLFFDRYLGLKLFFLLCFSKFPPQKVQGVQEKLCFLTINCNPSLASIAVRDLQSFQRNTSAQSLLLAGKHNI